MVLKESRFKASAFKIVSQLKKQQKHSAKTCSSAKFKPHKNTRSRRYRQRQSKTLGIVLNRDNTGLSNLIEFVSFTDDDQERYFTCEHKKGYFQIRTLPLEYTLNSTHYFFKNQIAILCQR